MFLIKCIKKHLVNLVVEESYLDSILLLIQKEELLCLVRYFFKTFSQTVSTYIIPGAIDKQKLVYILNRDSAARLTISSPLEAHKAHTVIHSIVGVDVAFENPIFACLELDYESPEGPQKVTLFHSLLISTSEFNILRIGSGSKSRGQKME